MATREHSQRNGDYVSVCIEDDDDEALAKSMEAKLYDDSPLSAKCCIFRIPEVFRRRNEKAYDPDVIAIGPFHHEKPSLQPMQKVKQWYLRTLLSRLNISMLSLVKGIKEFEKCARDCYQEPIDLAQNEFIEMLIIDGCFLVELFRKETSSDLRSADDPIFNMPCVRGFLDHDLLLLENQLPWFVLQHLFSMTMERDRRTWSLTELVLRFFESSVSPTNHSKSTSGSRVQTLHIVDLIRSILTSPFRDDQIPERSQLIPPVHRKPEKRKAPEKPKEPQRPRLIEEPPILSEKPKEPQRPRLIEEPPIMSEKPKEPQRPRLIEEPPKMSEKPKEPQRPRLIEEPPKMSEKPKEPQRPRLIEEPPIMSEKPKEPMEKPKEPQRPRLIEEPPIMSEKLKKPMEKPKEPQRPRLIEKPPIMSEKPMAKPKEKPMEKPKEKPRPRHVEKPPIMPERSQLIPCVSHLMEAGVKFTKSSSNNVMDIEFEDGTFKIPLLFINETTESIFRNLIAFEQCYHSCEHKITSYAILMDNLINTSKDVEILSDEGIIDNWLSAEDVSQYFNRLCNDTFVINFFYRNLCKEVKDYYRTKRHRWRAILMRDYFTTPWTVISLVAALILLVLTFLQTFYAIKQS